METAHESTLTETKFGTVKYHRHTYNFFTWIIILFDKAFKYGEGARVWGYVDANAEPPCVEFYTSVYKESRRIISSQNLLFDR
jgi:hypothetical protein